MVQCLKMQRKVRHGRTFLPPTAVSCEPLLESACFLLDAFFSAAALSAAALAAAALAAALAAGKSQGKKGDGGGKVERTFRQPSSSRQQPCPLQPLRRPCEERELTGLETRRARGNRRSLLGLLLFDRLLLLGSLLCRGTARRRACQSATIAGRALRAKETHAFSAALRNERAVSKCSYDIGDEYVRLLRGSFLLRHLLGGAMEGEGQSRDKVKAKVGDSRLRCSFFLRLSFGFGLLLRGAAGGEMVSAERRG